MVVFLMTDPTRKHSRDGVHVKSSLSLTNTVSICRGAFTWKTKTSKTLRKCGEKKGFLCNGLHKQIQDEFRHTVL